MFLFAFYLNFNEKSIIAIHLPRLTVSYTKMWHCEPNTKNLSISWQMHQNTNHMICLFFWWKLWIIRFPLVRSRPTKFLLSFNSYSIQCISSALNSIFSFSEFSRIVFETFRNQFLGNFLVILGQFWGCFDFIPRIFG